VSIDVGVGSRVIDHAGEHDVPEGGVGLTITTAAESISLVLAAAGVEGRCAAEVGEGRLAMQTPGVVTGRDEKR